MGEASSVAAAAVRVADDSDSPVAAASFLQTDDCVIHGATQAAQLASLAKMPEVIA